MKSYKLKEVSLVSKGKTITRATAGVGDIPVIGGGLGPTYFHNKANCSAPVITVSASGANAGFVNFWDTPIWASDCTTIVEKPGSPALIGYVYKFLQSKQKFITTELRRGSAQPHVYPSDIADIEIYLPTLNKQFEIVEKLDSAFADIERLIENGSQAKSSAESLLSQLIGAWIKSDSTSKKVNLGELAELKGRIGWRGLTAKEYTKEGPLFLSVHSLNHGHYVDLSQAFHITKERYDESPEIQISEGHILIAKDGAGLGKVGMVGPIDQPATVNSSILVVKPNNNIQTKYLYCYFLSTDFKDLIKSKLGGSTVPHLYQRDIAKIPVTFLSAEKQNDFIGKFDQASVLIDNLLVNLDRRSQLITELRNSILAKEFEAA